MSTSEERRGRWTVDELIYAKRLMKLFKEGKLSKHSYSTPQSMRCFLASKLNCAVMRVSKKFSGSEDLGVRYMYDKSISYEERDSCLQELSDLESNFLESIGGNLSFSPRTRKRCITSLWEENTENDVPESLIHVTATVTGTIPYQLDVIEKETLSEFDL
mmetsp:Transcript_33259/g.33878  ORF Transcript_33259/g.33878 Transcript_33259/m.33878 type:complete len:160 (-) Transcript_33259:289-768(-)